MAGKQKVYNESMRMAINYAWDSEWASALKAYRAALQEFPEDVDAMVGLGSAYFELEQYESAIRALQRALKSNPTHSEALDKMGSTLERMNRFDEAAKTYVYAGNAMAKANQIDSAINFWEKAIKADPDQLQARNNLAQALAKQGQTEQAVSELISIAAIMQDKGNQTKANQYLQGALQLNANNKVAQTALEALKNGVSIRAVQQDMASSIPTPVGEQDFLYFDAEEENFIAEENPFSFDNLNEDIGPKNPREQIQQQALKELANVLFEDDNGKYSSASLSQMQVGMLINKAIDAQTQGKTEEAIETYNQIKNAGIERPAIDFVLALLYMKLKQIPQAIEHFKRAQTDPSYLVGINFALGECYKHQKDGKNAIKHFIEVLKIIDAKNLNPAAAMEYNQIYDELAANYAATGDPKSTLIFADSLTRFLSSPNYEEKIMQAKKVLGGSNGTSVLALVEFLEAPNTDIILSALVDTSEYMRQNMYMTAIETCFRAIQKAPSYLPLHLRLAEIYMKQEAIENSIKKYLAVAEVYQIRNNLKQVSAVYERVLKVAPMDVTVRSKLVTLYINQNNIDAALEQYQILSDAYYQLAQIEKSLEKYGEALRLAPKASNPKMWQVKILHRIGDIYIQRVNWTKAVDVYEKLVKLAPEDDKALLALVDLYFKVGGTEKAIAALDQVMSIYAKQGRQEKLLEFLHDLIELRPHEPVIREKLASFYAQMGRKAEAISQLDILGEMQLDAGLRDDAARTIQKIISMGPENVSGYEKLLAQLKGEI